MTWTNDKPTEPGFYWYRHYPESPTEDYEVRRVTTSADGMKWLAHTRENGSIGRNSFIGEWYGPIIPPCSKTPGWDLHEKGNNARIMVRLKHGGSFYVEKKMTDDVAQVLSGRLKDLHKQGKTVPAPLRAKLTGVVQALVQFAASPATGK